MRALFIFFPQLALISFFYQLLENIPDPGADPFEILTKSVRPILFAHLGS